ECREAESQTEATTYLGKVRTAFPIAAQTAPEGSQRLASAQRSFPTLRDTKAAGSEAAVREFRPGSRSRTCARETTSKPATLLPKRRPVLSNAITASQDQSREGRDSRRLQKRRPSRARLRAGATRESSRAKRSTETWIDLRARSRCQFQALNRARFQLEFLMGRNHRDPAFCQMLLYQRSN